MSGPSARSDLKHSAAMTSDSGHSLASQQLFRLDMPRFVFCFFCVSFLLCPVSISTAEYPRIIQQDDKGALQWVREYTKTNQEPSLNSHRQYHFDTEGEFIVYLVNYSTSCSFRYVAREEMFSVVHVVQDMYAALFTY